ncbi:EAL domain-containing protein [Magnetovibrio sp. PR-2]|uniref:putative bifunctional diguanylate cyclase/phosphodiesterase n=1 Tax=Magnetovibrio sp. PR-2 TaxID=3120356 RepID=UPI002FCE28F9
MGKTDISGPLKGIHTTDLNSEELHLLSVTDEGVQTWDKHGNLIYANRASDKYFPNITSQIDLPFSAIINQCLDENGDKLLSQDFPISIVLNGGQIKSHSIVSIGTDTPKWLEISAFKADKGDHCDCAVVSTTHDVTALVEQSRDLESHAAFDALTGLPNRSLLSDRLDRAKARADRSKETLAICLLDLDGFKPVNDTLGHGAGDQLLKETARRLEHQLRKDDTALRLGGDEFVLIMGGFKHEAEIDVVFRRILQSIATPVAIDGNQASVTASIGVTLYPHDAAVNDQLMRHADQAMYKAKDSGKNNYHLFDPTLESRHKANLSAKKQIAKGLDKGQFELHFQPQVDCARGKVLGAEALIRWKHPILGMRPPSEFLPLIENDDLVIDMGKWVIDTAITQLKAWHEAGFQLSIAINISARHLLRGEFTRYIEQETRDLPPKLLKHIEFELLETAALEDLKFVGETINHFKTSGIGFALDDFGTGYSSLTHLKHLAVDTLKIDKSFVRDMLIDPGDLAIVKGVQGLSEAFHSDVIAEGVESIDQILKLLSLGCTVMQGFAIARPMNADAFTKWVNAFEENPLWNAAKDRYPSRQAFDILILEATQRHWYTRALNYLQNQEQHDIDVADFGYENTRVTKWYNDEGTRDMAQHSEFHEIDILNRKLCYLFEKLVDLKGQDTEEVTATLNEFVLENEKLISALGSLRVMINDT